MLPRQSLARETRTLLYAKLGLKSIQQRLALASRRQAKFAQTIPEYHAKGREFGVLFCY